MLLAIDAGNTNTTFAVFDGDEIIGEWRAGTNAARTADEYAVWLSSLMNLVDIGFKDIDSAIVASVVPQSLFNLRTLCRRYGNCEPLVVGDPDVDIGIKVLIKKVRDVGADRLVNAVAAHIKYGGPGHHSGFRNGNHVRCDRREWKLSWWRYRARHQPEPEGPA